MTLKLVTTKTLAAAMIAGTAVLGTSTYAMAAETSAPAADAGTTGAPAPAAASSGASGTSASSTEAGQSAPASASLQAEKKFDSIGDFLKHYKGQSLTNSQGGYQGECVSLISRALEEVHGVDHGAWGNAIDYQKGSSGGQQMEKNGFSWHTDQKFENGDILVWGQGQNTTVYGHIAIYYEGQIWQQNFNGDKTLHPYDGEIDAYLGYWRA